MITIYVFKNIQHYSDYYHKIKHEIKFDKIVESPLEFIINILDIDFDTYRQLIKNKWGMNIEECPFCFWHNQATCYLRPRITKKERINIIDEFFIQCPHLIYNKNYISLVNKRSKDAKDEVIKRRQYWNNFAIDWKEWESKLEK